MYDKNFTRAHDYAFWCQICDKATFKHVGETVCKWRWHKSNMSSGSVDIDYSYEVKIARRMLERYDIKELFPQFDWVDEKLSMTKAYLMTGNIFFPTTPMHQW